MTVLEPGCAATIGVEIECARCGHARSEHVSYALRCEHRGCRCQSYRPAHRAPILGPAYWRAGRWIAS